MLLTAGELPCRTIAEPIEADERAELAGARLAFRARHADGRQRITDVAGGAATKHRRALEHHGAMGRCHVLPAAPGHASVRGRHQAHDEPQEGGLAGAVRSDQDRGRSSRKHKRDPVDDRHAAGDEAHVLEHDRQIGDGRAHGHPANRSPARRRPQAAAFTRMTMATSTTPSPIASGRSPFEVSSAIAVVMVRVKPSILPPTMMMAPTSAAARPKPASSATTRLKRPSQINVTTRASGPTFMAFNSSRYSVHKSSMVCRVSAAMIGATRMVWATIMAEGVNSRPSEPSGPDRDSSR